MGAKIKTENKCDHKTNHSPQQTLAQFNKVLDQRLRLIVNLVFFTHELSALDVLVFDLAARAFVVLAFAVLALAVLALAVVAFAVVVLRVAGFFAAVVFAAVFAAAGFVVAGFAADAVLAAVGFAAAGFAADLALFARAVDVAAVDDFAAARGLRAVLVVFLAAAAFAAFSFSPTARAASEISSGFGFQGLTGARSSSFTSRCDLISSPTSVKGLTASFNLFIGFIFFTSLAAWRNSSSSDSSKASLN
mmetsp:Transcript_2263/g.2986  ORF Transcript_2263/g.2986 Transcript_2263/m.2986 type:complete len:248 (+) Transcript_2263:264-1007(+)